MLPCYAASNTSSSNSFSQKAQEFAETAQQRVQEFVQEQKLDEKAAAASKTAKEKFSAAYEETEQNVRRTYMKLESEHNIRWEQQQGSAISSILLVVHSHVEFRSLKQA
jgi:uncharacterized protein YpuA (DUF1002 family)